MKTETKSTPSPAAMRAAKALGLRPDYFHEEIAEIIDRETGLPELVAYAQFEQDSKNMDVKKFSEKYGTFPGCSVASDMAENLRRIALAKLEGKETK